MFKTLFGGLMVAVGLLIATASGLCTLVMAGAALKTPANLGSLPIVLMFGGFPCGAGVLLVILGLRLIRSADGGGPKIY